MLYLQYTKEVVLLNSYFASIMDSGSSPERQANSYQKRMPF